MKVWRTRISVAIFLGLFLLSCSTVPITGRKQLDFIPIASMLA
ncbi:MAG: hypothetical protein SWE60_24595 [Thermodesulfobacteriota bacterium]|nr:hypothetical protein [Thermodesulfobacteriota bacterium]